MNMGIDETGLSLATRAKLRFMTAVVWLSLNWQTVAISAAVGALAVLVVV